MANCVSDEDEPPPLEDMTEQLERAKSAHLHIAKTTLNKAPSGQSRTKNSSDKPHSYTPETSVTTPSTSITSQPSHDSKKKKTSGLGFGGLQKGFLSGSKQSNSARPSSKPSRAKPSQGDSTNGELADDMIRPKQQKSSSLEFPEVQEAMKESFPFLNTNSWVTEDLLAKIEKDPVLADAFKDPAMAQALAQFQTDPLRALAAAKDKPKIQKFFQSFSALMGDHFTALGEAEEKKGSAPPVLEIMSEEETKMRKILSKPEVKRALDDPVVRKLVETLKTDPNAAQRLFHSSSPESKQKIKTLIELGLLAVQ